MIKQSTVTASQANKFRFSAMKGKGRGNWNISRKLGLPTIFFLCFCFFLAGFFGSTLISQDGTTVRPRARLLESLIERDREFVPLPSGESGDDSFTSIPFQVLSWRPRILYFPDFATTEQCENIIEMAKPSLEPSKLALRKGETEETTKDVRTSSGMFISASEDQTGLLDIIEEKIARATMIPRSYGEKRTRFWRVRLKKAIHEDCITIQTILSAKAFSTRSNKLNILNGLQSHHGSMGSFKL